MLESSFATCEAALEAIDTETVAIVLYETYGNPRLKPRKEQEVDALAARLDLADAWAARERARKELEGGALTSLEAATVRKVLGEEAG